MSKNKFHKTSLGFGILSILLGMVGGITYGVYWLSEQFTITQLLNFLKGSLIYVLLFFLGVGLLTLATALCYAVGNAVYKGYGVE